MDVAYTSQHYAYHQYGDSPFPVPALNSSQNKLRRKRNMHRSTSRASKQRRDLINTEIARLRDLLPLPATVKTRLSYLHVMSLACVYIRKGNFFHQQETDLDDDVWTTEHRADFTQAIHGFLIAMTSNGKLLYMSENVTDYLGHSMVELLSTGGNIYDVIDSRDHALVRAHLEYNNTSGISSHLGIERTMFCRMNTSRNMRRRNHCADNKMVNIQGRFMMPNPAAGVYPWSYESIFVGLCTPLDVTLQVPNEMAPYNTNMFVTRHELDMTIKESEESVVFHLGYEADELDGCSWYGLIHHDDMQAAADYHQRILQSINTGNGRCVVVLRLLCCDYVDFIAVCITGWLEKDSTSSSSASLSQAASIICQNQVIRKEEIYVYKSMQTFFETSAKQPSNHSPSSSSSTRQDCTNCTTWQQDTQQQQHQQQHQQDEQMSIWDCSPDDNEYMDCYNAVGTAPSYAVESLPSCQKVLTGDTAPLDWKTGVTGTMTDIQYQNMSSEEGGIANDIKNDCSWELSCKYPFVSAFDSNISTETPLSERLQRFLIWANKLKVKEEYYPECNGDDNNGDGYLHNLSRPLSSCLYKTDLFANKPSLCQVMAEPTHCNSDTRFVKEVTSDTLATCDILSSPPTTTTKCIKVPVDQALYPMRMEGSTGPVDRSLLKVANGKVDEGPHCILQKSKIPGENPVGDSMRHAVRQAIGMLSSDQLHLLDEAISFCAPTSKLK